MLHSQLSQAKDLKIKSFLLKNPAIMLLILLLYSCVWRPVDSSGLPVLSRTGITAYTTYNSEVLSTARTMLSVSNKTEIKIANTTYDLELSKNLNKSISIAQNPYYDLLFNFTVETINATSIRINVNTLKHIQDPELLLDIDKSYRFMYNISYRLRTTELLLLKMSDHCFKVPMKNFDDVNKCTSRIYYFGHYNDSSDKNYDYLLEHCKLQSVTIPINKTSSSTVAIINNLLPSRYYEFQVNPYLKRREGEEIIFYKSSEPKHNCTKEGIPLYPPQTDKGSFEVNLPTESEEDSEGRQRRLRRVKLYWRPVPILFEGHNISTHLSCHEHDEQKVFYENTFSRDEREFYSFELSKVRSMQQDRRYICEIRSKNSWGFSFDSSIIQVPEQRQIIDTRGSFKIYPTAAKGGDYLVKWTDIRRIAPELLESDQTNQKGVYTVYWCEQESCELGIEAMKKFPAVDDNYNLRIPELIHIPGSTKTDLSENRRFGISYRSWNNKFFTGIHWSPCIGRVVHAHKPFEKLATHNISSDWISFRWDVHGGCLALLTLFDELNINLCELGPIDPCLAPGSTEGIISFNYGNTPRCFNQTVKNNLTTDATITNLKPATKYVLRVRALIHGKKGENLWSENLVFRTHPESQHQCKKISPISIVIIFIIVIVTCSMFFYCRKSIKHYKSILKLYKRTNVKLPQRFEDPWYKNDDFSEVGLRYWFNRDSQDAEPQLESSMNVHKLNSENNQILGALMDNFFSDEDNQSDPVERTSSYVPDYVDPSLLLTSQPTQSNQDNTQDNLTESLSRERDTISDIDEISINSHSSFLENILNDDS